MAIRRPNSFELLREYVTFPTIGTTNLQLAEVTATETPERGTPENWGNGDDGGLSTRADSARLDTLAISAST